MTVGRGAGPAPQGEVKMLKITATAFLFGMAVPAAALQPIHENPTVINGFYTIGLADELRRNCATIEPRMFRAYRYLKSLESYAKRAGYTEAQIEELADNREEKQKLRTRIRAELARRGAAPKTPEGYCTVGLEEIAKGSAAGRLLRAR